MRKNSKAIITVSTREATLKRRFRRHLKSLGFHKADDGALLPPGTGKDVIRTIHNAQRNDRLTLSAVGQRSNEIGLRIALGASRGSVLWLILRESLVLVCVGLTVGLVVAIAVARLLATMLFQVKPNDPMVYIGVAVLLGLMTLFASYVPATRAASIDPLTALRQE